jgi:mono/diheme cytochrome c family protein
MIRKVLIGIAIGLAVIVLGLLLTINLRWDRTFDAPYPAIAASTDSGVIARGRYLVFGPAHCAACHVAPADQAALAAGQQPPLSGGFVFDIPPGKFHVPNLTPDSATGIGRRSDGELARMLRHGVRADGRSAVPFMEAQDASDEDLTAVISFLRSQPAVRHEVPAHELSLLGKMVMSFMIKPVGPKATPPARTPADIGVERGRYLANGLASCVGCHTERSMATGAFTGPAFAGGGPMHDEQDPNQELVPPNLTPDSATGRIASWTEETFVARFRSPGAYPGSPMPWSYFNRTSDEDLKSIYQYLKSLAPVQRETGPSARPKSEE